MATSEVRGVNMEDLDKMFDVTEEKKQKMASFKGKEPLKMPEIGDKKGVIIRPLWSKDDQGNPTPIAVVKTDSPKVKRTADNPDGLMKFMTVEEYDDQGVEKSMTYGASVHYGFQKICLDNGWKFENIFGKWFKMTADEYDNPKAPSGKAKGYRLVYREDLSKVLGKSENIASQF